MKLQFLSILTVTLILSTNFAYSQKSDSSRYNLTKASADRTARYAVWRTDFYICTGISYAKSVGKTTEDFMKFVAETHVNTLMDLKGKGLDPVVNLINFVITNYPNGSCEILSESEKSIKIKTNRPYISYFINGYMVGVTVDEFERCLWGHLQLMLKSLEIEFDYHIEGDLVEATVTLKE